MTIVNKAIGRVGDGLAEVEREVFPGWIAAGDEFDFATAQPALELLLSCDGIVDIGEAFEVDEPADFVFCCVSVVGAVAVLLNAADEIVSYADIEAAGAAGDDVHEVHVVDAHGSEGKAKAGPSLRSG